jgi:hypothetical protein
MAFMQFIRSEVLNRSLKQKCYIEVLHRSLPITSIGKLPYARYTLAGRFS